MLLIDEVDSASNNHVFLDFLAQLRGYYINRDRKATFQSVILAGVHDIKNIKRKISENGEHKLNSPWNIAADYLVDMSFSAPDIAGMDIANPLATILSVAMIFRYSLDLEEEAQAIENSVVKVLEDGYRTKDIYSEGTRLVGTRKMGQLVIERLSKI